MERWSILNRIVGQRDEEVKGRMVNIDLDNVETGRWTDRRTGKRIKSYHFFGRKKLRELCSIDTRTNEGYCIRMTAHTLRPKTAHYKINQSYSSFPETIRENSKKSKQITREKIPVSLTTATST